jgi:hypothetical protein
MAVGLPLKTTYANGDVYSASDVNDTNGTINITAAPYAAGKNKILNSDYSIWQRGTTFTHTSPVYTADRWLAEADISTTFSRQTFTPGTAPVAGYEGQFFFRIAKGAGGTFATNYQRIEDVRTFAGQTATLSFWAKSDVAQTFEPFIIQNFGSGGSTAVNTATSTVNVTTSWARYSVTVAIPSVSGKTIGTSSYLQVYVARFFSTAARTVDIWGVQMENGSTATAFQTATGTIQGELSAAQRYYFRMVGDGTSAYSSFAQGAAQGTGQVNIYIQHPVPMRIEPTSLDYANLAVYDQNTVTGTPTTFTFDADIQSNYMTLLKFNKAASFTQYRPYALIANNSTSAYVGLSAEL